MRAWTRVGLAPPLLLAPAAASAQTVPYHMHSWEGGWGMMLFGPLFILLVMAGGIGLVVWLVRGAGALPARPGGRNPVDILKERFARGEIDKDEFEERRRILER